MKKNTALKRGLNIRKAQCKKLGSNQIKEDMQRTLEAAREERDQAMVRADEEEDLLKTKKMELE